MAGLKIFVSSTCIDLYEERNQLRNFLLNLGHEPVLSDHYDIHYNHDEHTHVSCIKQVSSVDIVVLLIGNRYGGIAVDDALKEIDLDLIQEKLHNKIKLKALINEMQQRTKDSIESNKKDSTKEVVKYGFSITHYEILRAIQEDIPIYAFVKDKIWNFNELYSFNKDNIEEITIPSIKKQHSKYLFEFIEILKNRKIGNSVFSYSSYSDIEHILKKQMAKKFKILMEEQKNLKKESEEQKAYIDKLTDRFDDLKEAIISVLPKGNEREVAKGVIRFRRLITSLTYMFYKKSNNQNNANNLIINSTQNFEDFISDQLKIKTIFDTDTNESIKDFFNIIFKSRSSMYRHEAKKLLISESDFFIFENLRFYELLNDDWSDFITLDQKIRETIVEALTEDRIMPFTSVLRYFEKPVNTFITEYLKENVISGEEVESTTLLLAKIQASLIDSHYSIFFKTGT
ncbi:DUF4062 domain-containing protein [Acinetobacter courvalinii]|uniref:DUF4062 domain-containing protein n=1 Tax=Acinetobacter courvalinii TaxID=280147 RepID=UPI0039C9FB57